MKQNKGITLIALVVTIIVLLILAGVSMTMIMGNDGIFTKAEQAKEQTDRTQELGQVKLAVLEAKTNSITGGQDLKKELETSINKVYPNSTVEKAGNEYMVTLENGNRYKVNEEGKVEEKPKTEEEKLLEKYFLGENGETKYLFDFVDAETAEFKDIAGAVIPNASEVFTTLGLMGDEGYGYFYFRYDKKVYKLQIMPNSDASNFENQSVVFEYEPKGREGQTVLYSYDGTPENEKEWTILYDYGDSVEIISPEPIGNLKLAESNYPLTESDIEGAIDSYNNVIKKINDYCSELVTNSNKISVRSVGSDPINPTSENTKMYKAPELANFLEGKYNGKLKESDENYKQDFMKILYLNNLLYQEYYFASRFIYESNETGYVYFGAGVEHNYNGGFSSTDAIVALIIDSERVQVENVSKPVRPIVKIKNI